MVDVLEAVGAFVRQSFGDEPIGETDDICTAGFVDSLFLVQAAFIHQRFGLRIDPDEFGVDSSRTIAGIASLESRTRAVP